jgi:AraC family transcriptional regulator
LRKNLELHYHPILAGVIDDVLRHRSGLVRVPDLASAAGFSRFHLVRMFRETTEETLEQFIRRIRLERAAYTLKTTGMSVIDVSEDCGYASPESFSRAFLKAFGKTPSDYRSASADWELHSPVDLHWNPDFSDCHCQQVNLDEKIVSIPARYACVWRAVGSYSELDQSWQRFQSAFAGCIPDRATFITIYLDNMWTHPVMSTMRADIGWLCDSDTIIPTGMRLLRLAGGRSLTTRVVNREERNDAWSVLSGRYYSNGPRRNASISLDEYDRFPVPFEGIRTKIVIGLATNSAQA